MLKTAGIYKSNGTIVLEGGRIVHWDEFSEDNPPELPPSVKIELTISFKENDLLLGIGGFVWATHQARQAEIIQNTLMAQHINSEIKTIPLPDHELHVIKVTNESDINDAIDFIWQNQGGLRLKPDWVYPDGEKNKSFEQWLGEH